MSQDAPTTKFTVPVRDLPLHRTVEVGPDYVAKVLSGLPMRDALGGDVEGGRGALDVELYADGTNVYAHGTMRGQVVVACSRCVGEARIDIEEPVRVTYMPQAELAGTAEEQAVAGTSGAEAEEGVELGDADLDLLPYDGESVDLEPILREQLVLAVPYAPLCREDCKGLCPQCGTNLNQGTCACDVRWEDPRLAALRTHLKKTD